jgi:hypothetical protein
MGITHIRLAEASEDVLAGAPAHGMEASDRKEYQDEGEEACSAARLKSRKLAISPSASQVVTPVSSRVLITTVTVPSGVT